MSTRTIALACLDADGGIGKDGRLPWRNQEEMRLFRALTIGATVVMGSGTYFSLDPQYRPLPHRNTVVLTSDPDRVLDDGHRDRLYTADTPSSALFGAETLGRPVYVVGGASVYEQMLPMCDEAWVSRLPDTYGCDTFFPEAQLEEFKQRVVTGFATFTLTKHIR